MFTDNQVTVPLNVVTDDINIVVEAVQRHNSNITAFAGYIAPTCTEPGKTLTDVTCSKCNTKWNTLETVIPALGHNYDWTGGKVYTAPTFDADGYYTYTCKVCPYSYTAIEGDKLIAVAKIGGTRYESLEDAVAEAVSGDTIELLMATAVEGTQAWNLDGITLQIAAVEGGYGLTVRGDLTVNSGNFRVAGFYGIGVAATGKLTVNGGEFAVAGDNDYLIGSYGTVVINGGTFNGQYNCVNGFDGSVTISGGTFNTEATDCTGEYESEDLLGNVTVTGGSFSKTAEEYLADGYCQKLSGSYYVVGQHKAGDAQEENKVEADCTNDGSYELAAYCAHCGVEMSRESFVITAPGHDYNWDGGKAVTQPTCTEKGYTTYTCSVCDETHTGDEVAAKGHLMTEICATPATCETDGNNAYFTCGRCSGVFKDENGEVTTTAAAEFLLRTGHNYDSGIIKEGDEPTCTEKGTKTFTCQNDANHTYAEEVAALGHDYTQNGCKVVTLPTCTEEGHTTYSCARCDHEEVKDKVSATGHSGKWMKGQAATCLDAGWIAYYQCQNTCGLFYEDMECTKLIGDADALAAWKTGAGATAAYGHNYTAVTGQNPDCVDAGYLAYHQCGRCKLYFSEQKNEAVIGDGSETALAAWKADGGDGYLKALGHTEGETSIENVKAPSCTADGSHDEVIYCTVCTDEISRETVVDAKTGHTEQTIAGKDPDCVNTGLTEGIKCSVCGVTLKAQEKVNALGHTEVIDPAVAATCTAAGKTEGVHCSVCHVVLTAQAEVPMLSHLLSIKAGSVAPAKCTVDGKQIMECTREGCTYEISEALPATGHTDVIDAAIDATCSKTGLTEGKHCSVCGETLVKQEVVPTTPHTEVTDAAVDATCTKTGLTEGKHCSVCNQVLEKQNVVAMLGHKEVVDAAVPETCTETGLTQGKHCSVCNTVLVAQKEISAAGHSEVIDAAKEATCTETGLTEGKHCSVCNEILKKQEVVEAKGHAEVVDPAVAAACEVAGKTEGKHCSRCTEILVAQEEIPALEHKMSEATCAAPSTCENGCGKTEGEALEHTIVEEEEIPPLCTEPGYTAGQRCSVCGTVIEGILQIAPSGHSIMKVAAKKPTFGNPGWEAYERCLNCNYTTMVEIPALPVPSVKTYDQFIESLIQLETLTAEYIQLNPGKDPLGLMIEYIRTGVDRYNSGSWNIMAGYEDPDYAKFISQREDEINSEIENVDDMIKPTALKDIREFFLPNGDGVDFGHMFGTMDITYHNNFSENHADVAGWAGDLVDLLSTADRHNVYAKDENGNYPTIEEMVKEIGEKYLMHDIAGEDDQFGHSDMYGDLDGFYLMDTLKKQGYELGDLAKLMQAYFTKDLTAEYRAEYFLKNRLDGVSTRNAIRDAAYSEYVSNKVISTLEGTRDFATADISQLRIACCYAFADYLCKLGGDYVEVPGNDYYTVFESEFSTLAPGITQEIKKATTADNKQIVYYIATADLNRSDVNIYANYNENDPTKGWKMSRVLDQAQAAQNRYGDPASAQYIENYNVITSINADGFNMSTGEPGGVLVMLGTEYHAINSSGFFGILKNGKAVIGTMADYNAMKDQVAEAVGGFGTMLVKDGKIAVSRTDSYYSDRASRTAVGITRSGKVIFMVLDGRQEPVSCGGSMQEIAQIMLEAGCYEAINLDGGGSTTYVAKPEGENELRVVSKPSDGFARSVSTSLMMVSTAPSSTAFDHAMVESDYDYLTPGSTINVTAKGVSATGNEAELPEGAFWSIESDKATITEDGVLTALGLGTVNVNLMVGDKVIGSKMIQIVNPDAIYFTRETLNAVYGSATELPIKAQHLGKPIAINTGDISFTLGNEAAGSISGFSFTAKEGSGVKVVKITATLTADNTKTASISVSMFNQGEMSFDFDKATGGDRVMAWDRQVSNATTDDQSIYEVVELGKPMVTTYTFALDMSQISMPEQIAGLTYMLPGADAADASAWNFLLQLAERVSVLTEVTAKVYFDKNFDVDYSQMKIVCEYFVMNDPATDIVFNAEENSLSLTLHWKDQTQAIDPETADPLCLLSGIKLMPKEDAAWDAKDRLIPVHSGNISYNIFLRANALYTFASKEANQLEYGLQPFENKDVIIGGATEKGGSFKNVYVTFEDTYTLINAVKNGWVGAEGGYMYYIDGVPHTGIQEVDGYWYDFGENGICIGQQKYNGLFVKNGKTYYARFGVLVKDDWMSVGGDRYRFGKDGAGLHGTVVIDEVELKFENGKMIGGYSGFIKKSNGKTYHYDNGAMTLGWYLEDGDWYHFDTGTGVMNTGTHVLPDAEAKSKNAYYDFAPDGKLVCGYFNPAGYYYWPGLITGSEHAGTGLPKIDQWVQSGSVADDWPANGATKDSWYRTNSHGHFVTGGNSSKVFKYEVNGVTHNAIVIAINGREYTFDNDYGYLLRGFFSYEKGNWFYYWLDETVNDGWFDVDGETYYAYDDGHLAVGSHVIDGKPYMFNTKGQLIKDGIRMYVTFNKDNTVMTVSTSETKELASVSIAIWSDASNQADMIWFEAEANAKGEWTANVPLCLYQNTGNYQFHAYATNNKGETALLVNTTSNVTAVAKHVAGEAFEANRTAPTCTVDGGYDMIVACTRCETELSKEHHVISAAHTPGEPVAENVKEAACVNGGSYDKVVYCSVCNAELSRVEVQIPAGTHEPGTAVKENEVAETCTTDGGYDLVEYCVSCQTELSRKHVVLKATGHQNAEAVVENEVAATCTTDGGYDTVVYCSVCKAEITREHTVLKATGHTAGDEVVENKFDVTCLADGSYELATYCTVCKEELSREKVKVPAVGHQYTDSKDDTCNVCGESRNEKVETTPMYRLYNPNSGEHFYTGSVEERDMLVTAGWNYEGVAWNAPVKTGAPVYRLFNPNNADHHYTMSIEERDWLVGLGWNYEGVAWNSASASNLPQYRMYNPNAVTGSHHYTGSVEEREMLVEAGWIYEGIGWFGMLK